MITLNNWAVVSKGISPYQPPETVMVRVQGETVDHPKYDDGSRITTSDVVDYVDGIVTTRSGTEYKLGIVDPDYADAYPNWQAALGIAPQI